MRGVVPEGSPLRAAANVWSSDADPREGVVDEVWYDPEEDWRTYIVNDEKGRRGVVLDIDAYDPKTGTAERRGKVIHDQEPPMEHRQPSYPDAVELPDKVKSLYQIFQHQQKQIQLLQRQMKMLIKTMDPMGPQKEDAPSYGYEDEDSDYIDYASTGVDEGEQEWERGEQMGLEAEKEELYEDVYPIPENSYMMGIPLEDDE